MLTELDCYRHRLDHLHQWVIDLVADLPVEVLNWRPFETGEQAEVNSLAVLTAHIAGTEHFWMAEVIDQQPATRNRQAEFACCAGNADEMVQILEKTALETRDVFARLCNADLDDVRMVDGHTVYVRWAITQAIEHTALHFGHMQMTYQMFQQGKCKPTPFWYAYLPSEGV
ncbi:MAG: DinB family protein [Anaerolineae bacterium]|nr:DinB family protein [Anaerolineae bacterium]